MSAVEWREITISAAKNALTVAELRELINTAISAGCPDSTKVEITRDYLGYWLGRAKVRWQPKTELVSDDGE